MTDPQSTHPRRARQFGPDNPAWQGGRRTDGRGYVLLRWPDHPRAMANGYVYEHIVIAEQLLDRPLAPGEEVHHKNEDKSDNRPENLEVHATHAEHAVRHRQRGDLQLPGEPNPLIPCGCGCGQQLPKYDASGRPRRVIYGHFSKGSAHSQAKLTEADVLVIRASADSPAALAQRFGVSKKTIRGIRSRRYWRHVE